jgi:hypothetical protein
MPGHGQHSSKCVICVVLFVIHVVLLLIVLFYVLLMCKCVLPPGVNPIAVDKYINYQLKAFPASKEAFSFPKITQRLVTGFVTLSRLLQPHEIS